MSFTFRGTDRDGLTYEAELSRAEALDFIAGDGFGYAVGGAELLADEDCGFIERAKRDADAD